MRYLMCLLICLPTLVSAQVSVSLKKHDFGKMDAYATRTVDVDIVNNSPDKVFILRVATERQVRYIYTNQTIQPNSKEQLRLKVNPAETGKFRSEVYLYLSSSRDPIVIVLKGEIDEMPVDASPDCPDFSGNTTVAEQMEFDFRVKVIDEITKEPIDKASVMIVKNGRAAFTWKTNRQGKIEKRFQLGYYYFVSTAEDYYTKEFDAYVNKRNHTLIIELRPKQDPEPVVAVVEEPEEPEEEVESEEFEEIVIAEEEEVEPEEFEEIVLEIEAEESEPEIAVVEEEVEETPEPPVQPEPPVETAKKYVANNIVFVVDVSWSMSQDGKLDLLKASMLELLDVLREEDRITVLAFAASTEVLVEPTPATAANKAKIEEQIKLLSADGNTNGGKGIRMAYRLAEENFIDGGNNSIIMATDGAFNQYDAGFTSAIRINAKKGIHMSVAGVKAKGSAEQSMIDISELGKGRYVKIADYDTALGALKKEIKDASKQVNP